MADGTGDTEWQQWLDRSLKAAGVAGPSLDSLTGGAVTPSMRSNWKKGRSGASPTVVVEIANALGVDAAEGLRAAGHHIIAAKVGPNSESAGTARAFRPPMEDRIEKAAGLTQAEREKWLAMYRMDAAALDMRYASLLDMYLHRVDGDRFAGNGSDR